MAIIPWQDVTAPFANDGQTLAIYWGPLNGGDEGQPIRVYAYDAFAWQFTGNPQGGVLTNPNVAIVPDRSVTVLGSNDEACWGRVFELMADPPGMMDRTGDPLRVSRDDGKFISIKPVVGGSVNPLGPDCGLILFCAKVFGPRV